MGQVGTGPELGPRPLPAFCYAEKENEEMMVVEQVATPQEEEPETVTEPEQQPSEHMEGLRCREMVGPT